jgi:O-methyltransferase involved in polyketide biosynthesis
MTNPLIGLHLPGVVKTTLFTLHARADEYARSDALFRDERAVAWFKQVAWDQVGNNNYLQI